MEHVFSLIAYHAKGEVDGRDCIASFCIDVGPMWTPDVPGIFPGDGKWPDFMF